MSLTSNTTGDDNTAIGFYCLADNIDGISNVGVGGNALRSNTSGNYNTVMGANALIANTTGVGNTAAGFQALYLSNTGHRNTAMGYQAGESITTGSYNILIGQDTEPPTATSNSRLNIGNTIYGDLSNDRVGIGTATLTYELEVAGDVNVTGCYRDNGNDVAGNCYSDARVKRDIRYLSHSLDKVAALKPARFQWREEALAEHGLPPRAGTETGLVAQDVVQVLPHLVKTGKKGLKKVVYGLELQMHMIQAIKELKAGNESLRAENRALKGEVREIRGSLRALAKKLALLEHGSGQRLLSRR